MDLVVVGSIGLDTIETPFGKVKEALGGAGIYAASSAAYFAQPGLVGIMGVDFPKKYLSKLCGIDMAGVERKGKNFRWVGAYHFDMNEAQTIDTQINSLAEFNPVLPESYKSAKYVLLGNTDPDTQLQVISQLTGKPFIMLDTMNFWINSKLKSLVKAIEKIDFLVINDGEARQLTKTPNLIAAGKALLKLGPKYVAIKKGEHGALLFSCNDFFIAPSYPLEVLKDPTGCGDTFAGGMIGYLAKTKSLSKANIRKAIIFGSVIASFCAEDFSLNYRDRVALTHVMERYKAIQTFGKF